MKFWDYQLQARQTAQYDGSGSLMGIMYCGLGVAGEAGEVADQIKKVWRNEGELTDKRREKIEDEMGDNLWYLAQLATELGANLDSIADKNLVKLKNRQTKHEVRYHD